MRLTALRIGVGVALCGASEAHLPTRSGRRAPDAATAPALGADTDPFADLRALSRAEALLRLGQTDAALRAAAGLPHGGTHGAAVLRVHAWALVYAGAYPRGGEPPPE